MILDASGVFAIRRDNQLQVVEADLTRKWQCILDDIQITPTRVAEVMKSLPPRAILPLDESDIVEAVTCESLRQIGEKSKGITPADAVSVQYLSTFVGQLISGTLTESRSRIPQSPYVTDYLETGDYQTAGDTAVYGYLFLQEKRRQQLSSTDYLHMASQSYFRWYGRRPTSIGYLLAERVAQYLPTMQGALKKVFPEVAPSHLRLI